MIGPVLLVTVSSLPKKGEDKILRAGAHRSNLGSDLGAWETVEYMGEPRERLSGVQRTKNVSFDNLERKCLTLGIQHRDMRTDERIVFDMQPTDPQLDIQLREMGSQDQMSALLLK